MKNVHILLDQIQHLIDMDHLDILNTIIGGCDCDFADPEFLVGICRITYPIKDKLPERAGFYRRLDDNIVRRFGLERAERELEGLE